MNLIGEVKDKDVLIVDDMIATGKSLVEAVRMHHRPDLTSSPTAGLLFLAEHLAGSEEDSCSEHLLEAAFARAGIRPEGLEALQPKPWAKLLLAA